MAFVISSFVPFPEIAWWCNVLHANKVIWEGHERFEKMTSRNRYCIAGAGGMLKMSIPIEGGRERKSLMSETFIAQQDAWQKKHWRTIVSAYNNAPYFEYYKDSLEQLFTTAYDKLSDFNLATVRWLKEQTEISFAEEITHFYQKDYQDSVFDLRRKGSLFAAEQFPVYYQVFEESTGFIPNLSLLDLLFAEGPYTRRWLLENSEDIIGKKA